MNPLTRSCAIGEHTQCNGSYTVVLNDRSFGHHECQCTCHPWVIR